MTNSAQYISDTFPVSGVAGAVASVAVVFENTGDTTWVNTGGTPWRLGFQDPQDNVNFGVGRVELPHQVAPGSNVTFAFNIKIPATQQDIKVQMVQDGVEWFGDSSPTHYISIVQIPSLPSMRLYEDECSDVSRSVTSEPKIHGITAKGFGNQIYSDGTISWKGIWIQGMIEIANGFRDTNGILVPYAIEQLAFLQQDYQWALTTFRKIIAKAGDFIEWHPAHEKIETLSIITIEKNSDDETIIELASKGPDFSDSWEMEQNISSGYTDKYLQPLHEDVSGTAGTLEFYLYDPGHPSGPIGEMNFAVPTGVLDATKYPVITLDLAIDFKTDAAVLSAGSCAIEIKKSVYLRGGNIIGWTPGATIKQIDVTSWITAGATNTFSIGVYMAANYTVAHSAYTEHPKVAASGTLHFWRRKKV